MKPNKTLLQHSHTQPDQPTILGERHFAASAPAFADGAAFPPPAPAAAPAPPAGGAASAVLTHEQIFGAEPLCHTLRNGLTVLFAPEHTVGLVSAQVWVKTGSIHEGDLLGSGLSHYLEHLVFKGTKKYSCLELAKAVQAAGATMNAYTTYDRTVYHIDGPSECAELALDVLAEMTLRPLLDAGDAARERDVILREIDMRDDDPDSILCEATIREVARINPCRFPIIGLRDAFAALTHEQVLAYHRARYVPNNLVLVVAGALDEAEFLGWVEKYFGDAPSGPVSAPNVYPEPDQLAFRTASVDSDAHQILRGSMTWRIPGTRHPHAPELDVFALLLGSGESSRLHKRLHDELALVHSIDASNWCPEARAGILWVSYTADPGQRAAIEAAVLDVIETVLRDGFREAEFAKARRACLMAFLENRKTVYGLATQLGILSVVLGDPGYPRRYFERVESLTPENVLEVARRHVHRDMLTCVAMQPRAAAPARAGDRRARATLEPFTETRLDNGLRILLQPSRHFPKVNFRMMFPGGGASEPAERRGLCALLATLLTRDTENRTAGEVAEAAETLGASLADTSGNNSLGVVIETLSADAPAAAALLADAVLRPSLRERTFQLERDDQLSSIREDEDDVVEYGRNRLREFYFGTHPLAVAPNGRKSDLERTTAADVRALHANLVHPENAVLAVSGDLDPAALLDDLSQRFADWRPAPRAPAATTAAHTSTIPAHIGLIAETRPCEQALVFRAYPDTGITAPDFIAGQLLDDLLTGMASQLFTTVREERGMAYFVGASRVCGLADGMFYLYGGTAPRHVDDVLHAMEQEIARARAGQFTTAELDASKARLRATRRMSAQSLGARTLNAALNALYGLKVNRDAEWEEQLDTQTPATLARFATKYFQEAHCLSYIITPKA